MCQKMFSLDIRKNFSGRAAVLWNGLPREVMELLSTDMLKKCVDVVLGLVGNIGGKWTV